jgi:hypothetical protein
MNNNNIYKFKYNLQIIKLTNINCDFSVNIVKG